jgi:hypothetical protein
LIWRNLIATHDFTKTYLAEMIRVEGVRDSIPTIGAARFGAAPAEVVTALASMTDFDQLHCLLGRLFTEQTWHELLAPDAS